MKPRPQGLYSIQTMRGKAVLVTSALLVFYACSFVVLTHPLTSKMPSCFVSEAGGDCRFPWQRDSCIFVWNIYNFAANVEGGANPFFTDRIFYPYGTGLWLHVYAPVYGLAGLATGNPVLALNLVVLASFVLSGFGTYLLCRHYVRDRLLAALAGLVFAFCPYKLSHLRNHYDLMLTATIPFFVLFLLKALSASADPGWPRVVSRRYLAAALACFGLTLFSCYYYTFFLLVFAALLLCYFRFRLYRLDPFSRKAIRFWVIAIVTSTAAVNLLKVAFKSIDTEALEIAKNGLGGSSDLLAFLLPSATSRFLQSDWVRHIRLEVLRTNSVESTVYIGYTVLIFAAIYLVSRRYRSEAPAVRMLSYMAGCFTVLAMPMVRVVDVTVCALPSALLHFAPFLNNFRAPYRYDIMLMLFLPIISCLFLERQILTILPKPARYAIIAGLVLLVFAEYAEEDYPLLCRAQVPAVYSELAASPDGVLLEVPFGLRDGFKWRGDEHTDQLFYQTVHHKRIVAGVVSRSSGDLFDRLLADPVLSGLVETQESPARTVIAPTPGDVARFLETFDVRYVLIHPGYRGGPIEALLEAALAGYVTEDREVEGFRLWMLGGSQGTLPRASQVGRR